MISGVFTYELYETYYLSNLILSVPFSGLQVCKELIPQSYDGSVEYQVRVVHLLCTICNSGGGYTVVLPLIWITSELFS